MREWSGKRYWLVGASEGLGRELAMKMSRAGVEVVVSARSEERLQNLVAELPGRATYVPVDIADRASVEAAAKEVGRIDGVVFLAGIATLIRTQEWDTDRVEQMLDVNLIGAARVIGQVIGPMVERDAGHIVLIGSLSAYRGLPGSIGYSTSKAGLMALAEAMHGDLRHTALRVQLANPGYIDTRMQDDNPHSKPFMMSPEEAAGKVFDHMNTDAFHKAFPFAFGLLFRLSRFLPTGIYEWIFFRR
ncbi:SDR family NAD(P)-dependent oxidoreductase [Roseibacterium sp. SDUM158017]|uniref:SDR family NAD(P)-dependent oxidoreductase n=1 Tax=Roseicyclus salinarum TaxID=3036773 RepID=UPI0024159511|nr:SDR family NAD(P)-dependent oxidoreductase [Roseibacterium sp. SDUM158017]MDG4650476.1 SDR family NAD(P)-dependent oxidoreductase [Roseibacterium sp. SDUM158017]